MKTIKFFLGAMLMACIPFTANAQFMFGGGNRANQDSLRKIAAADYADMLAKVGVGQPMMSSPQTPTLSILIRSLQKAVRRSPAPRCGKRYVARR